MLMQEEILASSSGLLNYLFGKNRDQSLTKEKFKKLQTDLLDEIVQLEFREYDTENTGRISEADFVNFLLKNGKLMPKKRAQLIKKVQSRWPAKGRGVSLPSFKVYFPPPPHPTNFVYDFYFLRYIVFFSFLFLEMAKMQIFKSTNFYVKNGFFRSIWVLIYLESYK